jgi:hypothetical protein
MVHPIAGGVKMAQPTVRPRGTGLDLRSSASASAIELDNLLLGRSTKTIAIRRLIDILESGAPEGDQQRSSPMALITPTVVVMDRVVRHAKPRALLKEVIAEYDSIVQRLKHVANSSNLGALRDSEPDTLKELRGLCLAISRYASSFRKPPSAAPRNTRRS